MQHELVVRSPGLEIGIDGGVISVVGEGLDGRRVLAAPAVLPGLIDVHVHFNQPGRTDWEGAATGSLAFAAGGGTLYCDMPLNSSPCTVGPAEFEAKLAELSAVSHTDFALWGGLIPGNRDALPALAERGVIGFKAFLSDSGLAEFPRADDGTLYLGMRVAARHGLPVAVHAENDEICRTLAREASGRGVGDYLASRPVIAEVEAIHRAALLAGEAGAKLHIVHVSSGRGVVEALEMRARGVDLTIETCPHYLFFTETDMERLGAVAKCAPPLRPAAERDALLARVREGMVDIIGSDHSPAPPEMKSGDDFFAIWGGISGGQSTLGVLLQLGFGLDAVARMTGANPAERFRLPRKGRIAPGYDADLVLLDPAVSAPVTPASLLYRHRQSPYVSAELKGAIQHTLLRGEPVTGPPRGRFVRPEATHAA